MISGTMRAVAIVGVTTSLCGCFTTALMDAAGRGDITEVRTLLDQGEDIHARSHYDHAALYYAAQGGHLDIVALLMEKGATQGEKDDALHGAAFAGRTAIARVLLENGADINSKTKDSWGEMPLHQAVYAFDPLLKGKNDTKGTVRFLLDKGADVNGRTNRGWTPLMFAAEVNQEDVLRMLLDEGASIDVANNKGQTALHIAEKKGHAVIVRMLKQAEARLQQPQVASMAMPTPTQTAPRSDVDRVPALSSPKKKNAYAVVIGIEQYREKLPKADYADRDAKLVGEYLTKVMGYPEENVIVRTNDRATRTDLEKFFEAWLPNNVEKDSSVFIYYSGHGAPNTKTGEAYLVPYDGDPTFVDRTGYPIKQLYAALAKLPTTDVTVVLDSCFSGAGGRSVISKGMRPMALTMEDPMLGSGNTIVLAASSGDQVSGTYEEQGHGLLTYYFLKGLQGEGDSNRDGVIDMAELYEYVKPNVQRIARKQHNNEQTPQLLGKPEALKKGGGRLVERVKP